MVAAHPCTTVSDPSRPTVISILRTYAPGFLARPGIDFRVRNVLDKILSCRTAALGGHLQLCGHCGLQQPMYNSCRDRHCPQCGFLERALWVEARVARMLPCRHVHMVFTVPAALRPLATRKPALLYEAMFEAVRRTLCDLGEERLGARLGVTAVLHTWNQALQLHPHIHCLVTAGGLSLDGQRWVPAPRTRWLFPQGQLRSRFKYHLLRRMDQLVKTEPLDRGDLDALGVSSDPQQGWKQWLGQRHKEKWVVYAKVPFANAEQVLRYLGHYTHRVGISNHRILSHDPVAGTVTFRTRRGPQTVTGVAFVTRFARHILPKGFRKIRHFGLLAPGSIKNRLPLARRLLMGEPAEPPAPPEVDIDVLVKEALEFRESGAVVERTSWEERASALLGRDVRCCPRCQQPGLVRHPLPRARGPP